MNEIPETERERLKGIVAEYIHWTLKEDVVLHELVDYIRFVRGAFVTRAIIPPSDWKLLWTELSDFVLFNICTVEAHMTRGEMLALMDICCESTHVTVTNPLRLFCLVFTCTDPKFVMTKRHPDQRFLRGFKNAQHALLEESIDFQDP